MKSNELGTEQNTIQHKCEELILLQRLPTEPKWKPSLEELPTLKLKPLPDHFENTFLWKNDTLLVIIAKSPMREEKRKLLEMLEHHMLAFEWTIADSPVVITHHIYTNEGKKLVRQPQMRLNLHMQEIVKNEVIKLLEKWLIYLISDSRWVSSF